MLRKFSRDPFLWIPSLSAHAGVHALFTFVIVVAAKSNHCIWLALLDFAVHFTVDRVKASPNFLGRWKAESPFFWWTLGADQMAHHLTHYCIVYLVLYG